MMMRNIARQAAGEILRDFEASGVDEDLELLRSAWKQPARQAKDVLKCARCAHENDSPLWTRAGERLCTMCGTSLDAGPKTVQPGWRGPLDPEPEHSTLLALQGPGAARGGGGGRRACAKPPPPPDARRVRGGELDYRSQERLETIQRLRRLSSDDVMVVAAPAATPATSEVPQPARKASEHAFGSAMPRTDWATWEAAWKAELEALEALERQHRADAAVRQREAAAAAAAEEEFWRNAEPPRPGPRTTPRGQRFGGGGPRASSPPRPGSPRARSKPAAAASNARDGAPADSKQQSQQSQNQQQRQQQQQQQQQRQQQQQQRQQQQQQQRPAAAGAPPRPANPPAAATPKPRAHRTYAEFDAAWRAFEAKLPELSSLGIVDIPFPPSSDVAGFEPSDDASARKKK
eukprot:4417943-Prymnesium_polylepis.1